MSIEIRKDADGKFDELVGHQVYLQIEMMDTDRMCIIVSDRNGGHEIVWVSIQPHLLKRPSLRVNHE